MRWYNLDKNHRIALKRLCFIIVIVMSLYSFTLQNEVWIWIFKVLIPFFAGYGFYLDMLLDYENMRNEIWKDFQKELEEIKNR